MEKKMMLGLLALSLTGCVTTQSVTIRQQNSTEPEVFMSQLPSRHYIEISYIEAAGGVFNTKKQLLKKLKERAKKENADALIQVKFNYAGWLPYSEGIAIKYTDAKLENSKKE